MLENINVKPIPITVSLEGSFISVNDKATIDAFHDNVLVPAVERYNKKLGG